MDRKRFFTYLHEPVYRPKDVSGPDRDCRVIDESSSIEDD